MAHEDSKNCEKQVLIENNEFIEENEFNFPRPLINLLKSPSKYFGQNYNNFVRQCSFDRTLLRLAFVTFTLSLLFGIFFSSTCYCQSTFCSFFIIQGLCGLIIGLIHFLALIFDWQPINMIHYSENNRLAIKLTFLFANILTVFCIIWFLISRFLNHSTGFGCYDGSIQEQFAKGIDSIIIFLHYLMGISYVYNRLRNKSSLLNSFNDFTKNGTDELCESDENIDKITENISIP